MTSKAHESGPKLRTYTIYADPLDAPGLYVVRGFTIVPGADAVPDADPLLITDSLERARAALPPGLHNLGRDPSDHPSIAETWI